jgi:hypothetical protein
MRTRYWPCAVAATLALSGTAAAAPVGDTYTLYRNSVLDAKMRLHIATFDATDGASYNRENCDQARELFQGQAGVKTKFWCEPGRFQASASAQQPKLSPQFTTGSATEITCNPSASELAKPQGSRRQVDHRCGR